MKNEILNYLKTMCYCLNCRKNAESKNRKFVKTKKKRILLLSKKCVIVKNRNLSKSKKLKDY